MRPRRLNRDMSTETALVRAGSVQEAALIAAIRAYSDGIRLAADHRMNRRNTFPEYFKLLPPDVKVVSVGEARNDWQSGTTASGLRRKRRIKRELPL